MPVMKAVIQRVTDASVTVGEREVARIGRGLLVLLGVERGDGPEQARWVANKLVNLRIFGDDAGNLNRSLLEVGGEVLSVSQFTLAGSVRKGRRPSFDRAAGGPEAEALYNRFLEELRHTGVPVQDGEFGALMSVALTNDGPVTFIIEKPAEKR
jgi:D-tyrosyl-tRNA(Tyr) deacylase